MKIRLSTLIAQDKKNNLHLYSVHSTFGQSFKFHGASLWNELPKYFKDIQSVKKFKKLLKLRLLS